LFICLVFGACMSSFPPVFTLTRSASLFFQAFFSFFVINTIREFLHQNNRERENNIENMIDIGSEKNTESVCEGNSSEHHHSLVISSTSSLCFSIKSKILRETFLFCGEVLREVFNILYN